MKLLARLGKIFNFSPNYLALYMVGKSRNATSIDVIFARYIFTMWKGRI